MIYLVEHVGSLELPPLHLMEIQTPNYRHVTPRRKCGGIEVKLMVMCDRTTMNLGTTVSKLDERGETRDRNEQDDKMLLRQET